MNQVPHSGPTNGRRHRTELSRSGHLARCICAPLVSVLRVVKCVTSYLVPSPCSLLDTKQVCGKFTAVHWKPPQTAHRSVWTCVSGCFLLPAFHNYTSQQLAVQNVQLRRIILQWPLQYLSALWSAQMFLKELCVASSVFRRHVVSCGCRVLSGRRFWPTTSCSLGSGVLPSEVCPMSGNETSAKMWLRPTRTIKTLKRNLTHFRSFCSSSCCSDLNATAVVYFVSLKLQKRKNQVSVRIAASFVIQ